MGMRTDIFKDVTGPRNQFLWLVLAFQSGFMNAGGFLAVHQYVSHVTGYGTSVGLALGQRSYARAFELAVAPACFLLGAMSAGVLVDRRLILGKEPRVQLGLGILAFLNFVVYLGEYFELFGVFGEPLELQRDFLLLFILCFACGLQNGLFTTITGGAVRTTHLTGPTTDIGLYVVKVRTLAPDDPERKRLAMLNWVRLKIVIGFSSGSAIAALVFAWVNFEGFAVPCATGLMLLWQVRRRLTEAGPIEEG